MSKKTLILAGLVALFVGVVIGQFVKQYTFPNIGTVTGTLEFYMDGDSIMNGTTLDWGPCARNETVTFGNFTVKNVHSANLTAILNKTNIPAYLTLGWGECFYEIAPGLNVTEPLTLTVAADAPLEDFSFAITVTGVE